MNKPDPKLIKRTNFDMIHMTFILKSIEQDAKKAGKVVVTLPLALLSPEKIESGNEVFDNTDFPDSAIYTKVIMGKTKFPLFDIKNLEQGDVVVFENSNIHQMTLSIGDNLMEINLNPNMDLIIPEENNTEGENMAARNLWDSIEVEMNAEFDSVKITLKELKNIEEGLVVDLTSLYDNNVTLKVEDKPVASGSLVIVNDRYGVKIDKIYTKEKHDSEADFEETTEALSNENSEENEEYSQYEENDEEAEQTNEPESEEDFDYSDFELEDENL